MIRLARIITIVVLTANSVLGQSANPGEIVPAIISLSMASEDTSLA